MPENLRATRRKIRAITNIGQITRAMKMVATAKLQRLQARVRAGRAYVEGLQGLVERLSEAAGEEFSHPYLELRPEPRRAGVVLVAGDKGLCGSYNANALRAAGAFLATQPPDIPVVTVASKAHVYATRRGLNEIASFEAVGGRGGLEHAARIAMFVRRLYEEGRVDELYIVFTRFVSIVRHVPTTARLLPVESPRDGRASASGYIFEPPAPELLGRVLPQALDARIIQILLEAEAAEQGARMTAMSAATDSARDMVTGLTRQLNRARQYAITREILDIIGGADALSGRRQ